MKRNSLWILAVLFITGYWSCQSAPKEIPEEQAPPEDTRNVPGMGMPRGLISKDAGATNGYLLFSPLKSDTTYLVNSDGEVVHTWKSEFGPSGWVYLKENGNLLRGGRDPVAPVFAGGGQGGYLQEFTWDGKLIWQYRFATDEYLAHHDVAILPNGNILTIAWEAKSVEDCIQAGRNPETIPKAGLWPDMIVELEPRGTNDARIVWKWHFWDHMIQDFDETKANYGNPAEHPELLDLNWDKSLPDPLTQEEIDERRAADNASSNDTPDNRGSDMLHTNAIDYNAELDQIALSSPSLNEILVIDHSTTTEEAAGHRGGRWKRGGDILYRWGNPQNYNRGDSTYQRLAGQHDVKWIPEGFPGEGNLLLFNNVVPGSKPPYSSVLEISPPLTPEGYVLNDDGRYGPDAPTWIYIAQDTLSFFGPFISGAQRLANGNTLITEGPRGRFFEVTPEKEIVWEYWTPYSGSVRMPDGTSPQPVGPFKYATFRATHIPSDHPAVAGKKLLPLEPQPPAYVEK